MNNKVELSERTVSGDPFSQFSGWYSEHLAADARVPDSVALGTASYDGMVSLRMVLLKRFDEKGFIFYTNYNSRKGKALTLNPNAALLFYWPESARQVRIEGFTEMISERESTVYFISRPRESRISSWISNQSQPVPDRKYLEREAAKFRVKYKNKDIPKPPFWGGFRVIPTWFEFWQEGKHRLHDRIIYTLSENIWHISRLAP